MTAAAAQDAHDKELSHTKDTVEDVPPPVPSKATFYETHSTPIATTATPWRRPQRGLRGRFDALLPRGRYCGRSRSTCLIIVLAVVLALLALAIGLGVGLSRHKALDLPLPSKSETFTGDMTYYGTGLGACGIVSHDTDLICAVSMDLFDAVQVGTNPNANPLCGRKIRAKRFNEQAGAERSVDLIVVDRCVGCKPTDLDFSPTAFSKLANRDLGRVTMQWAWLT